MHTHTRTRWPIWLLLWSFSSLAAAQEIAIPLSNGERAVANYHPGEAGKPAVFILHGFLQTYHYSTVQLITEVLADNGYTVLAPTLTLNIDQRRNGLGCDAIQNHRVADSNREIAEWMRWLHSRGHLQIITIGHSSGSMRLLSYISEGQGPLPVLFIATSIGPIQDWRHPQQTRQQLQQAKQLAETNPRQISNYTLAFCRDTYSAPAEAYLSYMQWSEHWVLAKLQQVKVPLQVVLGSKDSWLPPDWSGKVAAAHLPLTLIDEATHNFTGPQEFEFQDLMLELVAKAGKGKE